MHIAKKIILLIFLLIPTLLTGFYIYAYSPTFVISPHAQTKNADLLPQESFTISFEKPIDTTYYKDHITIEPHTAMTARINDAQTEITVTPKTAWLVDQKYTISLPQGRTKSFLQINGGTFHFTTTDYPQVIDVVPQKDAMDVRLDIEDPLTIQFDKSTQGFFVDFQLDPPVPVKYQNNERKTQFDILPLETLAEGTKYTLTMRIKPLNARDTAYAPLYTTSFTTIPPKPKTWAENLQERLEQARRFTEAKIKNGKYIDVNLSTQVMTIFENGRVYDSFLISSGKPGMNTPTGTHQIYNKNPRPWSKQYSLFMPFWMAITPDGKYGIHELPEWPGGFKEGQNHLGIPVSHGCMRLGIGPAKTVYEWAEIGTPVVVY